MVIIIASADGGDPVQENLLNYSNTELAKIVELEEKVTENYETARENYTDDYSLYVTIRDEVIPYSKDLIDAAEEITPATEEVRTIHETYLAAINEQDSAFTMILSALENHDYAQITQANEKLAVARKSMRDFLADIKALGAEHNVEFENMN